MCGVAQVKTFVVYFYRHIREKNGARPGAVAQAAIRAGCLRRALDAPRARSV